MEDLRAWAMVPTVSSIGRDWFVFWVLRGTTMAHHCSGPFPTREKARRYAVACRRKTPTEVKSMWSYLLRRAEPGVWPNKGK